MAAAAANMPADMRSPGEWLNEMHDAGGKAVKEWLATARDREGKLREGGASAGGLFRFTPPPGRGGKRRASGSFEGVHGEGSPKKDGETEGDEDESAVHSTDTSFEASRRTKRRG